MPRPLFRLWLVPAVALGVWASSQHAAPRVYEVDDVPASLRGAVETADAAFAALQRRLGSRLLEQLKEGGPARAVTVCRDEAPVLTEEIARAHGVAVGRTSHRLRNPKNAPPTWARRFVEESGGRKKAADAKATVVDLGGRVGVLRPISTGGPCLSCHGRLERIPESVSALLKTSYPADRAIGFEEGDLRGFFWAEVPSPAAGGASGAPRETP